MAAVAFHTFLEIDVSKSRYNLPLFMAKFNNYISQQHWRRPHVRIPLMVDVLIWVSPVPI
ncbi:hypothetical protein T01_4517 [Trichinella spiralis]|uniref:Uncharacterized protein n=1 Tax=Trichinella spiralis TaxID=6334 RepID=A0A0V1BDR5_TRISP|nr:hypothetical protein T01_4517 [Trichinella spiralis]